MPRKPLAFLTMDSLGDFVAYDHLAKPPLDALGWQVVDVPWRNPDVDWNRFEAVIIRTPWDYHHWLQEFLGVIDAIDQSVARLLNSRSVIRWNIDKRYLRDLERQGLPIVPTLWIESPTQDDIARAFDSFGVSEMVIKPVIGAGARDTFHIQKESFFIDPLLYQNRFAMVQPFVHSVVEQGEWSLLYFAGRYSHTVLKTPKPGDFRVQEEFGSHLQAVTPTDSMLAVAQAAVNAIVEETLYARVDLVLLDEQSPAIIELELIEPSLYFPFAPQSPQRFAEAIDQMLRGD